MKISLPFVLKRITAVLLAGVVLNVAFLLYIGEFQDANWGIVFAFVLWSVLPHGTVALVARLLHRHPRSLTVLLIGAILLVGSSVLVLVAVSADTDPQSGLTLLIVPFYQLLGTLVLIGVAFGSKGKLHGGSTDRTTW